jgi:hypothetical protein
MTRTPDGAINIFVETSKLTTTNEADLNGGDRPITIDDIMLSRSKEFEDAISGHRRFRLVADAPHVAQACLAAATFCVRIQNTVLHMQARFFSVSPQRAAGALPKLSGFHEVTKKVRTFPEVDL